MIGLETVDDLVDSEFWGHLFEAAVIAEVVKRFYARGRMPNLAFWRDTNRNEIDLLVERGLRAIRAIEIKSSMTYKTSYFDVVAKIAPDLGLGPDAYGVVYGGEESVDTARGRALSFRHVEELLP